MMTTMEILKKTRPAQVVLYPLVHDILSANEPTPP
jgi:hypothetical protein